MVCIPCIHLMHSAEIQRLNYENEQLRLRLNQRNPNSTTQPANVVSLFHSLYPATVVPSVAECNVENAY